MWQKLDFWWKKPQANVSIALLGLALFTILTRFWGLDRLAPIVFDEVYYPKFAQNYLQGEPFFDAHPPLGKYLIALGIHLFGYNPFGYRCITALAGALVPLVTFGLVYQLDNWQRTSSRLRWAFLAGLFTALDGLLLVESRYGLINIYVVLFGMGSQLCLVVALQPQRRRWLWVIAAAVMLGSAASVKWSGLAYLVGWGSIVILARFKYGQKLSLAQALTLLIVPFGVYLPIWIPHLLLNPEMNLLEIHQNILAFHQNLGVGKTEPIHPYCSSWWTWLWTIRPISYFYKQLPNGNVIDVVAMGNPFLAWIGSIAILGGLPFGIWLKTTRQRVFDLHSSFYLVTSFAGHLLPWSLSKRCTFIYHYMPASVFAFMSIALIVDWLWRQEAKYLKNCARSIVAISIAGWIFWLPFYLGLPISPLEFRLLMWFPSWI